MSRRRKNAGSAGQTTQKVCGFRLDEHSDQRLQEMANRFATTPSKYARAVLTTHLLGDGAAPAGSPAAHSLDELGTFVRQVRDELLLEMDRQGKRVDAFAARMNAVIAHVNALTKKVGEVDQRLAQFLARVQPM